MPLDLSEAIRWHQHGQLDLAARRYEEALRENPDRAEALHLLGVVLLQRNQAEQARSFLERAVALDPEQADAHSALGEAYRQTGRMEQSLASCHTAARLRPASPELLSNLGALLVDLGQLDDAIAAFREALRLAPQLAALHANLGNALAEHGQIADALNHLNEAVRLEPASAEARANLATRLLEQSRPFEALPHAQQVVASSPMYLPGRLIHANALLAVGKVDEAEAAFRAILQIAPGYAPAHAGLGSALEQLGQIDDAIAAYRTTLEHDPKHAGALARLATRLRGRLPESEVATMEGMLTSSNLSLDSRTRLAFGLGQVHDARGNYPNASAWLAEANRSQSKQLRQLGRAYDPVVFQNHVNAMIAAFDDSFFERTRGWGSRSERPVFIVGLPRSGTTLLEQILSCHPQVHAAGELRLAQEIFDAFTSTSVDSDLKTCCAHLNSTSTLRFAERYLDGLTQLDADALRVVDKMPENYLFLGLIAAILPHARVVHCVRDSRDVALSCWMNHFGQVRWASDPSHIVSRIHAYRKLMSHWRSVLPISPLEVRYEDVVDDLGAVARRLVEFCGLDWDDACLRPHEAHRPVQTVSVSQVRQPVYRTSIGRWRNYESLMGPFFDEITSDSPG